MLKAMIIVEGGSKRPNIQVLPTPNISYLNLSAELGTDVSNMTKSLRHFEIKVMVLKVFNWPYLQENAFRGRLVYLKVS